MSESRVVSRFQIVVCEDGHVEHAGEPDMAAQIRCRRGHWTWADGRFCTQCGVVLDA